jgi:hypothetical protein
MFIALMVVGVQRGEAKGGLRGQKQVAVPEIA